MVDSSSVALGLIGLLLVASVGASNAVVAGQRTVLDQGFVSDQLAEEGLYETMEDQFVASVEEQVQNASQGEGSGFGLTNGTLNTTAIAEDAITREYLRNQTEANVGRLYDYLHGRTDDLVLAFDLRPLKGKLSQAVGEQIGSIDVGEFAQTAMDNYEGEAPFDPALVEQMTESEQGYQDARQQFRSDIKQLVLDRMANETYDAASTERDYDKLLALVIEDYDPRDYSYAEKRRMVENRETEIKTALKERAREEKGDEIDQRIEEEITQRHDAVRANVTEATKEATSDQPDNVTAAAVDLNVAIVDGLMGDTTYAEFSSRVADAKSRLATAAEQIARDTIDEEVPDQIDASEQFGNATTSNLQSARGAVGLADLLGWALPLLSVGLVGLAFVASRSLVRTARTAGIALLVAGISGFVAALVAGGVVETTIRDALASDAPDLADALVGIFQDVLGTLSTQSLALAVGGAVLTGLAFAAKAGYLDGLFGGTGPTPAGGSGGTAGGGAGSGGAAGGPSPEGDPQVEVGSEVDVVEETPEDAAGEAPDQPETGAETENEGDDESADDSDRA
ncbi:hypothetical protein ACKVMT_00310 [Halobacteriales archaeon Cl-PHB]